MDVLGAVRYLRENGATSVAVIGAAWAAERPPTRWSTAKQARSTAVVLLAPAPIQAPERVTGPKLVITAADDPITPKVREQYAKEPEPKELQVLDGSAHAQFLLTTPHRQRIMAEILSFLGGRSTAAR